MRIRNIKNMIFRFFSRTWRKARARPKVYGGGALVIVLVLYFGFLAAPFHFPVGAYVNIPSGKGVGEAAKILKDRGIIRSEIIFKALVYVVGEERHVIAGEYFFPRTGNVFTMAIRLGKGDFEIDPTRVRVPEGSTVEDIAKILSQGIPNFNLAAFMHLARGKEGYLFPDTYFFMPGQGVDEIVATFSNNFSKQIAGIQKQIDTFGKPMPDVIVMASLLEKEAPKTEDRRIIAGILWKRLKLGMALQVDAVFPYILGKNSFELTKKDLKFDSPYNTYLYKGLPPGPIANPGRDAILAAVTPIQTEYLYYLSDMKGNMHYSATYDQHLALKNQYLR